MALDPVEKAIIRNKTAKPLLWLMIVSMTMLFAGLTSAIVVRQAEGNWLEFELPQIFYLSTVMLLVSSITMKWALVSAKKDNAQNIKRALMLTLLLGLGFVLSQFKAWDSLVEQGVFFVGNVSGSFLYVVSGLHLAHLTGGLIFVSVVLSKAMKEKYNSQNKLGLELCSIYWHYLDILWVYLFLFLIYIR